VLCGFVDVLICDDLPCCTECSLLSMHCTYIRKQLFYPHSIAITWCQNWLYAFVTCIHSLMLCIRIFSFVFVNIDTIRAFRMLGAILFFLSIVLAVISGYLTECRMARMCVHFMSYFANCRWFFGTICTNTAFCYVVFMNVVIVPLYNILWLIL